MWTGIEGHPRARRSGKGNVVVLGIAAAVALIVAVVLVLLLLRRDGGGPGLGYDSPEAVFQAYSAAMAQKDWKTILSLVTPEGQERMMAPMAVMAIQVSQVSPDVKDLCNRHGIDPDGLRRLWSEADSEQKGRVDPAEMRKLMLQRSKEVVTTVGDKAAFFAEMMAILEKLQAEARAKSGGRGMPDLSVYADAKLTELKFEGDTASGTGSITIEGKTITTPMTFQRLDGRWYLAVPEGGAP